MEQKKSEGFTGMSEIKTQFVPPRIVHNKREMDAFLAKHNIVSQWPAVTEQLPTTVVEGLFAGAYNPSIIRFQGKLLMVYRFHPDTTAATKLAIAELDDNFIVTSNQELDLRDDNSCEDARAFVWKKELWICYVSSTWPTFPASSTKCIKLAKPDHWRASDAFEYWLPDRQTMEKNHLPLPWGDELNIIYRNIPEQVIYTPADKREMKTPGLRWPFGEIRGGTVPLPYQGKLLRFFHSSMRNEMPPLRHRYYLGAMLMKAEPPFQMLAVSKRPILRGSELGGDTSRHHHKPNVVFVCGAIEHEGGWLASCGCNDSASMLVKISEKDLNL
jgi:predicted GH43/DUF377 family glycosyl hydrolase